MKLKSLTLVLSLVVASSAFAGGGDELGNGGDALVCMQDGVKTYRVFDLADPLANSGFTSRATAESEMEIQNEVLEILRAKDPARAALYEEGLAEFARYSVTTAGSNYDVRDEGVAVVPDNCKLKQVIIQFKNNKTARFYVNLDLYFKLPVRDRVALRFHELIYREGLLANKQQFETSQAIRRMTAFLFSNELKLSSQAQYDQFVNGLGPSVSSK